MRCDSQGRDASQDPRDLGLGLERAAPTLAAAMAGAVSITQHLQGQPPSLGELMNLES